MALECISCCVQAQNSKQQDVSSWMTGIQEVALPMDFKLRNIEETEAAKKRLLSGAGASTARYHNTSVYMSCKLFMHGLLTNKIHTEVLVDRLSYA